MGLSPGFTSSMNSSPVADRFPSWSASPSFGTAYKISVIIGCSGFAAPGTGPAGVMPVGVVTAGTAGLGVGVGVGVGVGAGVEVGCSNAIRTGNTIERLLVLCRPWHREPTTAPSTSPLDTPTLRHPTLRNRFLLRGLSPLRPLLPLRVLF